MQRNTEITSNVQALIAQFEGKNKPKKQNITPLKSTQIVEPPLPSNLNPQTVNTTPYGVVQPKQDPQQHDVVAVTILPGFNRLARSSSNIESDYGAITIRQQNTATNSRKAQQSRDYTMCIMLTWLCLGVTVGGGFLTYFVLNFPNSTGSSHMPEGYNNTSFNVTR